MLAAPPGLADETLTEELTDMIFRYLVHEEAAARQEPMDLPRSRSRRRSRG
jgi:hypothetical protein